VYFRALVYECVINRHFWTFYITLSLPPFSFSPANETKAEKFYLLLQLSGQQPTLHRRLKSMRGEGNVSEAIKGARYRLQIDNRRGSGN
jgi:hypothetical protein